MFRTKCILIFAFFLFYPAVRQGNSQAIDANDWKTPELREHISQKRFSDAKKILNKISESDLPKESMESFYFTKGIVFFELGQWDRSIKYLKKAIDKADQLAAYSYFHLAVSYLRSGEQLEAQKHFNKSIAIKPSRFIEYRSRFYLSQMNMELGQWYKAYLHLKYLERKWRSEPEYPEVLWRLVQVEMNRGRKSNSCYWARRLYWRHPTHPLIFDWGIDLQSAKVNDKRLGCVATTADKKRRIRRLQWAGESDRARQELELMRTKNEEKPSYPVDKLLAEFLVNEGFVDEALEVLIRHYNDQKKNFEYLNLLAKAASRAGHYQTAVGSYYQAYKLKWTGQSARNALFRAAFLSYQFQDYDGAARKFTELTRRFSRSGLVRDARWHLAWIRYLKGDYSGAIISFEEVLKLKKRFRRYWREYPTEKIQYWMAMSYMRMEDHKEARKLFENLSSSPSKGFYSLAASNRAQQLPPLEGGEANREISSVLEVLDNRTVASNDSEYEKHSPEMESEESLEPVEEELTSEENDDEGEGNETAEAEELEDELQIDINVFRAPKLQRRFSRASLLQKIGFYKWARWELYEIERRTRNKEYLSQLINSYEQTESFNRSSYISQVYFRSEREKLGLKGAKAFWQQAYPKAFSDIVEKQEKDFGVAKEMIWSIMRAESFFKTDVSSPVGARGLMQLMPFTAHQVSRLLGEKGFHVSDLVKPEVNVRLGTRYLQRLGRMFKSQPPLMAAGYNAGPHRVESWLSAFGNLEMDEFIEHIPFVETRNYVKKVVANYGIYKNLYQEEPGAMAWLTEPIKAKIPNRPSPRESWEEL